MQFILVINPPLRRFTHSSANLWNLPLLRLTEIKLPLDHTPDAIDKAVCKRLKITPAQLEEVQIYKRGVDARRRDAIALIYTLDVRVTDEASVLKQAWKLRTVTTSPDMGYKQVAKAPADFPGANQHRPIVIGTGPCGLFAALILARMGFKPLVLERGQPVKQRTKDTFKLWREHVLNPESNVQFGEGGAGTFSDGKLYSQIKDPLYLGRKVLEELVAAGAPPEILYVSKPHIGTFKLVAIVEHLRNTILSLGGEIRFGQRVDDLEIEEGQMRGVVLADGTRIAASHVIMAVGHSARDTFVMLRERGVYMEAKPFSVGFRIEHPQSIIDEARFGRCKPNPIIGAADYRLVHHCKNGRSVYSFCMCPGGTVVAAASEPGKVVTNGMSQYSRNERNANSGIVVGITPEQDYPEHVLAGMDYQRKWEANAFELGGSDYRAPAQLVGDFLAGRPSTSFGSVEPSYTAGVKLTDLSKSLPADIIAAIKEAIPAMARQLPGFSLPDAILTGVETRTSSPIRIKRGDDFQSINTQGLYPAGEGAGYAGGILSAAVDGIKAAQAVGLMMVPSK